jgi:hypothetical protein
MPIRKSGQAAEYPSDDTIRQLIDLSGWELHYVPLWRGGGGSMQTPYLRTPEGYDFLVFQEEDKPCLHAAWDMFLDLKPHYSNRT